MIRRSGGQKHERPPEPMVRRALAVVLRAGIEPATPAFSVLCSTNGAISAQVAGATGIEPAISGVTGRRVNRYTTPPRCTRGQTPCASVIVAHPRRPVNGTRSHLFPLSIPNRRSYPPFPPAAGGGGAPSGGPDVTGTFDPAARRTAARASARPSPAATAAPDGTAFPASGPPRCPSLPG